jgi:hypothetical protein
VKRDYKKVAKYTKAIQAYVRDGGIYMGVCLGAYLAGGEPDEGRFFDLLDDRSYVNSERYEKGAQIRNDKDSVIKTDWTWNAGPKRGQTETRWQ